jgi:hypothetical protein
MKEVTAFLHPQVWLGLNRWQRLRWALRWKVVLDNRVPTDRVYLGRYEQPNEPPNGVFGHVFLTPRRDG